MQMDSFGVEAGPLRGFPRVLQGPMAWEAQEYSGNPDKYVVHLSTSDVADIRNALATFQGLNIPRSELSRETFPLPDELCDRLQAVVEELSYGRGFAVLRGLDPRLFTEEEHVLLMIGLGAHTASTRADWIDHIRFDKESKRKLTPSELSQRMDFHTDSDLGNILAMFTDTLGKAGGQQQLASFWTVYNDMRKHNFRELQTLAEEWHWEKPDRETSGDTKISMRRPIIANANGKVQINFGAGFVGGDRRYPLSRTAPGLTECQVSALRVLTESAQRNSFTLDQKPGDILLANNLSILHARGAFEDCEDNERHLIRLALHDDRIGWKPAERLDFRYRNFFSMDPMQQKYMTLSEWKRTPRRVRVAIVGSLLKHD